VTLALLAVVCGAVLMVAGGGVARDGAAAARTVKVKDNFYSPKSLRVSRGTTVKWVWASTSTANRHNVAVRSGPEKFRSSKKRGGSFSRRMGKSGTYKIYCTIHPSEMKMTLKVG
jgi:plastocyanin